MKIIFRFNKCLSEREKEKEKERNGEREREKDKEKKNKNDLEASVIKVGVNLRNMFTIPYCYTRPKIEVNE